MMPDLLSDVFPGTEDADLPIMVLGIFRAGAALYPAEMHDEICRCRQSVEECQKSMALRAQRYHTAYARDMARRTQETMMRDQEMEIS